MLTLLLLLLLLVFLSKFAWHRKLVGISEDAAVQLLQKYQIESFLKGMLEVRAALEAKRRLRSSKDSSADFPSDFGVEQMVTFQQVL